ncbi:MAG: GNAT family N-acetyltransferase [Saccharospirillum sp.]
MTRQPEWPHRIDWLSDAQLQALRDAPDRCCVLFGQASLLAELLDCMHEQPRNAHWYRPAGIWVGDLCVAAGGFKGPPYKGCIELGYRVDPAYRRQGHASALVRWLCQQAHKAPLRWVLALTEPGNEASRGVLAKNGFVHTGDLLSDRQHWLQRWQFRLF